MKKQFIFFVVLAFILTACGGAPASEQPSVETIVAGTLQALTASAPIEPSATAINGIPVTFSKISFVIPDGIATSATEEKFELSPSSEGMPWWETYPAHVEYLLQGYPIGEELDDESIYVYPIAEYAVMNEDVAKRIETLKSLIATPNQPLPEFLPFLPTFNAGQMFHSNFQTINFQNGSGIRYLTEFSQFPHTISNTGLVYTFQGITSDGLYYVSAQMPINIGFLIGYPTPTDQGDFVFIENEVKRVTEQLNNSKPESFTPSMLTLDALIQSINVTGIP